MVSTYLRAATAAAAVVALTASSLVLSPSASANGNCVTYWQNTWSGAPAAGGTGTLADPYLVGGEADLDEIRFCQSAHFRQIADITMTVSDWEPIDSFTGSYRGESHTITGLAITTVADRRGLFGVLDGARVTALTLSGVSIDGQSKVGGLAGEATNGTLVSDVTVAGSVSGGGEVGGVIGRTYNKTVVRNVTGSLAVTGTGNTGGLVGANYESDLSDAAFDGTVNGGDTTGGAVGYACTGELDRIAVSGTISATSTVGGIAGDIECAGMALTKSAADVTVTGTAYVGGAVG